jgi:type I restriction enzyme S subunit
MREVKFSEVLKQYKIYHFVEDNTEYRQVTISMHAGVSFRGTKLGKNIGRKRQFVIDLEEYPNTFIFTRQGVQNGSYGIAPKEVHGCVVTENMPMFSIEPTLNPEYLEYYLQTNHFQDQLQALNASGSAQKSIHEKVLLQLNILLPDIEEQKSIVDEIKAVENKQSKVLEELQTQSELINKLRSSILSDAVSGKLVPQDPNDESAKVLLEKIKTEKEKLIKEGKIKKQKPLPPISEDEIPYELPNGWVWCRLSNVCKNIHYGYTASAEQSYDEPKMLRITDIQNNSVNWERVPHCKISDEEMDKYLLKERDILVARTGGTVGKSFLMTNVPVKSVFASYLIRLIPSDFINEQYLKLILESPLYWKQIIAKSMGTGQPNVNGTSLGELVMSFPPLEEQKRIVEKVEKLMATCDELELEVQNSKIETEKLMQSVLKEAFK